MVDPAYRLFERNVLPGLIEDYAGFSTARANAAANARTDLGDQLLMQRYQALQDTKNRALQAYSQVPTVQNYLAAPRVFQQAGLDRKYAEYIRGNEQKMANIDNALKFLGISTGTYTPGDQKGSERIMALLGMGGTLGAAGILAGAGGGAGGTGAGFGSAAELLLG